MRGKIALAHTLYLPITLSQDRTSGALAKASIRLFAVVGRIFLHSNEGVVVIVQYNGAETLKSQVNTAV